MVNGATLGDSFGDLTCYTYNGNSVVDYMMVSHDLKDSISHLSILDLTEHSDHRPLLCYLRSRTSCNQDISIIKLNNAISKLKMGKAVGISSILLHVRQRCDPPSLQPMLENRRLP